MDSVLRHSILEFLLSSADLLNFRQHARKDACVVRDNESEACIHLHQSRWLGEHYDWRFRRGNVLKSFSTRKLPAVKQMVPALQEPDRPVNYLHFSGTVPDNEVGAGKLWLIDIMRMRVLTWSKDEIKINLTGNRIRGQYILFPSMDNQFTLIRSK